MFGFPGEEEVHRTGFANCRTEAVFGSDSVPLPQLPLALPHATEDQKIAPLILSRGAGVGRGVGGNSTCSRPEAT